jgi:hypothetical protein
VLFHFKLSETDVELVSLPVCLDGLDVDSWGSCRLQAWTRDVEEKVYELSWLEEHLREVVGHLAETLALWTEKPEVVEA